MRGNESFGAGNIERYAVPAQKHRGDFRVTGEPAAGFWRYSDAGVRVRDTETFPKQFPVQGNSEVRPLLPLDGEFPGVRNKIKRLGERVTVALGNGPLISVAVLGGVGFGQWAEDFGEQGARFAVEGAPEIQSPITPGVQGQFAARFFVFLFGRCWAVGVEVVVDALAKFDEAAGGVMFRVFHQGSFGVFAFFDVHPGGEFVHDPHDRVDVGIREFTSAHGFADKAKFGCEGFAGEGLAAAQVQCPFQATTSLGRGQQEVILQ
ncbi:hypothetical protein GCM10009765_20580 [Fodinicola feengrottensis]|uniref:Uncharacterized protein n=1 Tax=Fodinicola feengrottensis TaxID=435914 RepID=A0ABN2GGZ8_9ACTN